MRYGPGNTGRRPHALPGSGRVFTIPYSDAGFVKNNSGITPEEFLS